MRLDRWVRREGTKHGRTLSDKDIDHLIWSHTGFPSFWRTSKPADEFRRQIRNALADGRCTAENCGDLMIVAAMKEEGGR